jgi:hypothetical protein
MTALSMLLKGLRPIMWNYFEMNKILELFQLFLELNVGAFLQISKNSVAPIILNHQ